MKLLIAEDDLTSRTMLAALTSKWGYEPVVAEDGEAAWQILQSEAAPRLLLLDWEMPKLSGQGLCQRIRRHETDDPPFIILLTARSETGDIVAGLEAGANEYISKPFENAELQARLLVGSRMLGLQADRLRSEKKLQLAASVFSHAREGITITDMEGTIIDVNDAFTRITGYTRDEVLGQNPRILQSGRHGSEFYSAMWRDLAEKGHWYGEIWNRHKDGEVFAEMLTISSVRDAQGGLQCYVALFSDITVQKEHQKQLEHIAHYDVLTNLPNRVLLADRMRQAMNHAQRQGLRVAVACLDLDSFKPINDNHGHEVGDKLLVTLADRMKQTVRESDTVARMGGDEFIMVLSDLAEIKDSALTISRLLEAVARPMQIDGYTLQVSASIGVTFFPQQHEVDADHLLRQADQAMYQAKLAGKNRYHIFDPEQDRNVRGHHESLEHIRRALVEGEFLLYYQPKVNMRTGEIFGVEALIRWQHPERGLLPPIVFLPVIEDHPLAIELGEWVIDTALTQLETWHDAGLNISVSVNIGARQLQQADFTERLRELLTAHPNIKPSDLELEVLETSALEDIAHISQVMHTCDEIGVSFALDDFGTGYSSLTYLRRLPAAQLKIDQSFVRNMLDDPDDLTILEGIIGLATSFRRKVIAEGVETTAHGELLLQLGCELAQGYGIARPMPADDLLGWVATWQPDPAWSDQCLVRQKNVPLLFACVEHRAWIRGVEEYVKGERKTPPQLDHRQCRFGQWLSSDGQSNYNTHPAFHTIDILHQKVHGLVKQLLQLHEDGQKNGAMERLDELGELRDALLAQLNALLLEE